MTVSNFTKVNLDSNSRSGRAGALSSHQAYSRTRWAERTSHIYAGCGTGGAMCCCSGGWRLVMRNAACSVPFLHRRLSSMEKRGRAERCIPRRRERAASGNRWVRETNKVETQYGKGTRRHFGLGISRSPLPASLPRNNTPLFYSSKRDGWTSLVQGR